MTDLLRAASDWFQGVRTQFASGPVTYVSGTNQATVNATVGRSNFNIDQDDGAQIIVQSRDYLILASDLQAEPQPGDQVIEVTGSSTNTYEVARFGAEPCWRWADSFFKTRRVHTKLLGAT